MRPLIEFRRAAQLSQGAAEETDRRQENEENWRENGQQKRGRGRRVMWAAAAYHNPALIRMSNAARIDIVARIGLELGGSEAVPSSQCLGGVNRGSNEASTGVLFWLSICCSDCYGRDSGELSRHVSRMGGRQSQAWDSCMVGRRDGQR
jgi:hypothetical protein